MKCCYETHHQQLLFLNVINNFNVCSNVVVYSSAMAESAAATTTTIQTNKSCTSTTTRRTRRHHLHGPICRFYLTKNSSNQTRTRSQNIRTMTSITIQGNRRTTGLILTIMDGKQHRSFQLNNFYRIDFQPHPSGPVPSGLSTLLLVLVVITVMALVIIVNNKRTIILVVIIIIT